MEQNNKFVEKIKINYLAALVLVSRLQLSRHWNDVTELKWWWCGVGANKERINHYCILAKSWQLSCVCVLLSDAEGSRRTAHDCPRTAGETGSVWAWSNGTGAWGSHLIMHRTIGLKGTIGPLTLTLVRQSVSPIVRCIVKCDLYVALRTNVQ